MGARKKTPRDSATPDRKSMIPRDYADWLASLKFHISSARQRATLAVNQELVRLYRHIGTEILDRQRLQGWGAKVIERLAADLRTAFPHRKGFSSRNLLYMRLFAGQCPDLLFVQQSAAQLPWFHIVTLLTKIKTAELRDWYAREAVLQSWPRDTLTIQIKNQLHLRQGVTVTNFTQRLAPPQADLAAQMLEDPYHFDFLGLGDEARERDVENALMRHITRFLLATSSSSTCSSTTPA